MRRPFPHHALWTVLLCTAFATALAAPTPIATDTKPAQAKDAKATRQPLLTPLAWLEGCWGGSVNKRDFREQWLPLQGDVMIGASQTAGQGKTLDYEFLRLEPRADGVYYVALSSGQKETAFRLTGKTADGSAEIFTFERSEDDFPKRIIYRRATEGWLYAEVQGNVQGQDKKVIYPMRRLDCQTGEVIRK